MKEEQAQNTEEQVTTQVEKTSDELDNASVSADKTSGKSDEGDTESGETEKKEGQESGEETFENKVTSLAQKIADKSTQTITKQRDEAAKRVTKLQEELNDKIFTSENEKVFQDEKETLGEDDANKRKTHREHIETLNKDFRQRDTQVKAQMEKLGTANLDEVLESLKVSNLSEGIDKVSFNVRNNKIKEELWTLIFPEDKDKLNQYTKYLKKFDKAHDAEDVELILGGIRETIKAKSKPFVPDSSAGGGGGEDLSKLSPEELITLGLKKKKK